MEGKPDLNSFRVLSILNVFCEVAKAHTVNGKYYIQFSTVKYKTAKFLILFVKKKKKE